LLSPIGILGGTFDPIHYGHLRLAQEMADALSLGQVRFIPTGEPWHRAAPRAPAPQRLEMTRLACAGNPLFLVDEREVASRAPGYTVDTLASLRQELGATQPLCLLLGADAFLGLETWHEWRRLFELAHIVVAQRPGFPAIDGNEHMPPGLRAEFNQRRCAGSADLQDGPAGRIVVQLITALDISASRIRGDIARGGSPRYLLPETVLGYISQHHLYQQ
jgi:nicotinate-nucleotide adenylyltransferase